MAVVFLTRLVIALTPAAAKLVRKVDSPSLAQALKWNDRIQEWLSDPERSDAELSEALSEINGYSVVVATFTGDFEVRRIQVEWSVIGATVLDEDIRVCTFHAIKVAGGVPSADWVQADFDGCVTRFQTWWDAIKDWYNNGIQLSGIKFYKDGPNIAPPQPPVFDATFTPVAGTSSGVHLPPQVALSVTERVGQKKNWGRFYLPNFAVTGGPSGLPTCTLQGRPATALITEVIDATDVMYEGAVAAGVPFVVYHPLLEANRPTGNPPAPSTLPERPANAAMVDTLQVDDVYDVIRRRRWENPQLRELRGIAGV